MPVTIKTNNVPRQLVCWHDLPAVAKDDFNYIISRARAQDDIDGCAETYMERFVQYKGVWYDVFDSQRIDYEMGFSQFTGWHGIVSDSYFSGVLFRLPSDSDDTVVCATYMC